MRYKYVKLIETESTVGFFVLQNYEEMALALIYGFY